MPFSSSPLCWQFVYFSLKWNLTYPTHRRQSDMLPAGRIHYRSLDGSSRETRKSDIVSVPSSPHIFLPMIQLFRRIRLCICRILLQRPLKLYKSISLRLSLLFVSLVDYLCVAFVQLLPMGLVCVFLLNMSRIDRLVGRSAAIGLAQWRQSRKKKDTAWDERVDDLFMESIRRKRKNK